MDLVKFGFDIVSGIVGGSTDIVGLVATSALGAMGINLGSAVKTVPIEPVVETIGYGVGVTVGQTTSVVLMGYLGLKAFIWAIFKFCPEEWMLKGLEKLAFNITVSIKKKIVKTINDKEMQLYIKAFTEKALKRVGDAIQKGLN